MFKKKGFTLLELLIVIVVIGILAATIIFRMKGLTSRARDTKRQADLRAISEAIQIYKLDRGSLPLLESCDGNKCGTCTVLGDVSRFNDKLSLYLNSLPSDPQHDSFIKIHHVLHTLDFGKIKERFGEDLRGGKLQNPGQYLYQVFSYGGDNYGGAVLVSKVESPKFANYVLKKKNYNIVTNSYVPNRSLGGGAWDLPTVGNYENGEICMNKNTNRLEDLKLCDKIKISDENSSSPLQSCEQQIEECKCPCIEQENDCEQQQQNERDICEQDKLDCKEQESAEEKDCNDQRIACLASIDSCRNNRNNCKANCERWDLSCKSICDNTYNCESKLTCGTELGCIRNLNCGGPLSCEININHYCGLQKTNCITEKGCTAEAINCGIDTIGDIVVGEEEVSDRCVYTPQDELYYIKVIR